MKPDVLLVEGVAVGGQELGAGLAPHFECLRVATLHDAMGALRRKPWAAAIAGYELGDGGTGLEVLQVVRTSLPRAFRVLHTSIDSVGFREDARRLGAPHVIADGRSPDLAAVVERALSELLAPPSPDLPGDLRPILDEVIQTRSPLVREFLRALRAAAESNAPVYLYGEPSTGVTRAALLLQQWRREWKDRGTVTAAAPVAILRVPALRERLQDLPLLATRCLLEHSRLTGEPVRRLSPQVLAKLQEREWMGNIVELASVLLKALRRAGTSPMIEAQHLPRDVQPGYRPSQWAKDDGQRDCLLLQLRLARSVSHAARLEGCSRANYIRLMRRLGIVRADVSVEAKPTPWPKIIGLS